MTREGPRGVVAAGHPATADAGAEVLRRGGNAADAAVAACLTATAAEPSLTGLGAGGFALVRTPQGHAELLDFFVSAPGCGLPPEKRKERSRLTPYVVPFRASTQTFNVGPASCAVPGLPAGLATLHERHGRLPREQVAEPAVRAARAGVKLIDQQDYLHEILHGILTHTTEMRAAFAPGGRLLRSGEELRIPFLARALEDFGREGAAPFQTGSYAQRLVAYLDRAGGLLTMDDLAGYRTEVREPVHVAYRGHDILTNPLPSSGGTLIAFTLFLLDRGSLATLPAAERTLTVLEALEAASAARADGFDRRVWEPGFQEEFLDSEHVTAYEGGNASTGTTTHVSVLDAEGMAVSVTSSCGSGSGIMAPETGIVMNNMMGEEDLNPLGFFALAPGERLTSMMAPTVVSPREDGAADGREEGREDGAADGREEGREDGREGGRCAPDIRQALDPYSLIAIGSAGSERLRSAIVQILVNMIDLGLPPGEAVDLPRFHFDGETVQMEPGHSPEIIEYLRTMGRRVNIWPQPDLYFGGAQVAALRATGKGALEGAGDPRRGGVVRIP